MRHADMKQAPSFDGWLIAVVFGAVAFGVAVVIGEFQLMQAAFVAGLVVVVAGLILGMPGPEHSPFLTYEPVKTPAPIVMAPAAPTGPMQKPQGLTAARDGKPDDLKDIKGIGPKLEVLCHSLGFFHFDQIAAWTDAEIAWVDENLEGFKGRVTRDDWVGQARVLAAAGQGRVH